jgi:hypothetical protein
MRIRTSATAFLISSLLTLTACESRQDVVNQINAEHRTCLNLAEVDYAGNWAHSCQKQAQEMQYELQGCLRNPAFNYAKDGVWCRSQYGNIDSSPNCTLHGGRGKRINETLEEEKKRCDDERSVQIRLRID